MKSIFTLTFILLVQVAFSQSLNDGISLRGLETNRSVYYYGEPIHISFVTRNEDSDIKFYWEPLTGVNFVLELVDFRKGDTLKLSYGSTHTPYDHWSNNAPPKQAAYKVGKVYINTYNIGASFGYEQLIKTTSISTPTISDFTRARPVGKYKLNVSYILLPGKEKLFTSFDFEVKPVPNEEQDAFSAYLEAMKYTSVSHPYYGDKTYSPKHNNSLENFIDSYQSSRYTQHAYSVLVNQVYWYHSKNIPLEGKKQEITKYLTEDKIQLSELRYEKSKMANKYIEKKMIVGSKEEIADKVLKSLDKQDPIISDILIEKLSRKHNLKKLKNYACEGQ